MPVTGPRLSREQQGQLALQAARFGVGFLECPQLLSDDVSGTLGWAVVAWVALSAASACARAAVRPVRGRTEVAITVVDVAAVAAVAGSSSLGYWTMALYGSLLLFTIPLRWGVRGVVLGAPALVATHVLWPSPDYIKLSGWPSIVGASLVLLALSTLFGRFLARQHALRDQTETTLALTFDHSPTGTVLTDEHGTLTRANAAMAGLCGRGVPDLVGLPLDHLVLGEDRALVRAVLAGDADAPADPEVRLAADGGARWVRLLVAQVPASGRLPSQRVVQVEDVDERRAAAELLAHEASHDPLTGLPNRRALLRALGELLAEPAAGGALAMVDLDEFKAVNDAHGHDGGDELLRAVADRLRSCLVGGEVAGRLAGDEMVVVSRRVGDAAGAVELGERVLAALTGPVELATGRAQVRASVGVRRIAAHEREARTIMGAADAALYRAKRAGRGRVEVSDPPARQEDGRPASPAHPVGQPAVRS